MAGLMILTALAFKGIVSGAKAINNHQQRTKHGTPLGEYTDLEYYIDTDGYYRLTSNRHMIAPQSNGRWLDLSVTPPVVIYDEFKKKAEHGQDKTRELWDGVYRSVYLKVNPKTYPYGEPAFWETKTLKQIALLGIHDGKCYIGYFNNNLDSQGGYRCIQRTDCDYSSIKEISEEYYERLNEDIKTVTKISPGFDFMCAYGVTCPAWC